MFVKLFRDVHVSRLWFCGNQMKTIPYYEGLHEYLICVSDHCLDTNGTAQEYQGPQPWEVAFEYVEVWLWLWLVFLE